MFHYHRQERMSTLEKLDAQKTSISRFTLYNRDYLSQGIYTNCFSEWTLSKEEPARIGEVNRARVSDGELERVIIEFFVPQ